MEYRLLGLSGLRVSTICLGTAWFGVSPTDDKTNDLVHRALDLGINFIDTANSYGNQTRFDREGVPPAEMRRSAEESVGLALRGGRRHDVIIASKVQERVGDGPNDGGPYGGGLTRKHIMAQIEQTLRRLQTDYIDVYYAHHIDPTTPLDQTMRTLEDLVRQGKVRYIALSNFSAWKMMEALWISDRLSINPPVCMEMRYNLIDRGIEQEIVPACQQYGLSITAWSPIAAGLFATPEVRQRQYIGRRRMVRQEGPAFSETGMRAAQLFDEHCERWGLPHVQTALAWVLSRPAVSCAIVGSESVDELEDAVDAAELKLDPEQLAALDDIAPPAPRPFM